MSGAARHLRPVLTSPHPRTLTVNPPGDARVSPLQRGFSEVNIWILGSVSDFAYLQNAKGSDVAVMEKCLCWQREVICVLIRKSFCVCVYTQILQNSSVELQHVCNWVKLAPMSALQGTRGVELTAQQFVVRKVAAKWLVEVLC